jgi:DNA-binding PadR family transcriptional regulator
MYIESDIVIWIIKYNLFYMVKTTVKGLHRDLDIEKFAKPHGAPRGLLLHYILCRLSSKPSHGYELLQDIEEKTDGAWRPGPGSIYPLLKKLEQAGFIEAQSPKGTDSSQKIYHISSRGMEQVQKAREVFSSAGQKWRTLSRIFVEMLPPKDVGKFVVDGSRANFESVRDTLESKLEALTPSEAEFILKEYSLNLQRQLEWTTEALQRMQKGKSITLASKVSR